MSETVIALPRQLEKFSITFGRIIDAYRPDARRDKDDPFDPSLNSFYDAEATIWRRYHHEGAAVFEKATTEALDHLPHDPHKALSVIRGQLAGNAHLEVLGDERIAALLKCYEGISDKPTRATRFLLSMRRFALGK